MLQTSRRRPGAWVCLAALGFVLASTPGGSFARQPDRPSRGGPPAAEAGEKPGDDQKKDAEKDKAKEPVVTKHTVTIGGKEIAYTATAGVMPLKTEQGKDRAGVFYIAYTLDGVEDPATRPLTFSFNGGPGSSSVWLHLGVFGPRRIALEPDGTAPPPPYRLTDNEFSLLDVTDLVFIDPVSTGFSRAAEGVDEGQFHGVSEDIQSVGDFIRLYATKNKRWLSPKFIAGESYGTTRAAGLSAHLLESQGMALNGVILISVAIDFSTLRFDLGNDLPYVLYVPPYAAAAHHHGRLAPDLQRRPLEEVVRLAEAWALTDYTLAMMKGDALSADDRLRISEAMARFIGIDAEYIRRADLRVSISRFTKELLRDQGKTIGRFDTRFTGIDRDDVGERPEYDPSYANIQGVFTACINHYVRAELGYESDLPYEILTGRVQPWNFGSYGRGRYVNLSDSLRIAMTRNPHLKVYVASGHFDLATPPAATDYTINHLGLDPSAQGNISHHYYEAGHMMYIRLDLLERMKRELAEFYAGAIP